MIPFVLGLLGALFYFGNAELHRFENSAARDILSKLHGEHAQVRVHAELSGLVSGPLGDLARVTISARDFTTEGLPLFTEPELSKKGLVRELRIDLLEFTLGGLKVQELQAAIPNCHFDYGMAISKRKIRLSESGVGTGSVSIRQDDLGAFIIKKFREIKRATVKVTHGRVLVEGYGEFLIVNTNFTVDAKLTVLNGTQLILTDAVILFDGVPADELSRKALLKTLNPVVDLNKDLKLYDAVSVESIILADGFLRVIGKTRLPVKPSG